VRKIFLLLFFLTVLALSPLEVQAQVRFCPPDYPILSTDGLWCTSRDGTNRVPSNPSPSPTPTPPPTNNPPANQTPTPNPDPGPSGGALPECTDNYSSAQICLPKNPFSGSGGIAGSGSLTQLAAKVVVYLLYFAGIVAVIFVIIGGYKYMTAGGNEETAGKGRKTMTQAIIGLVIVILAYVIVTAVTNFLIR